MIAWEDYSFTFESYLDNSRKPIGHFLSYTSVLRKCLPKWSFVLTWEKASLSSDKMSELSLFSLSTSKHCTIFKNRNLEINVGISIDNI